MLTRRGPEHFPLSYGRVISVNVTRRQQIVSRKSLFQSATTFVPAETNLKTKQVNIFQQGTISASLLLWYLCHILLLVRELQLWFAADKNLRLWGGGGRKLVYNQINHPTHPTWYSSILECYDLCSKEDAPLNSRNTCSFSPSSLHCRWSDKRWRRRAAKKQSLTILFSAEDAPSICEQVSAAT